MNGHGMVYGYGRYIDTYDNYVMLVWMYRYVSYDNVCVREIAGINTNCCVRHKLEGCRNKYLHFCLNFYTCI